MIFLNLCRRYLRCPPPIPEGSTIGLPPEGGAEGTYGTLSIIALSYGINSFITLYCNPFSRSYQSLFSSFIGTSVDRTPLSTIYKRTSLYRCCSWIFSSHFFTIFEPLNSVSKRCRPFSISIFDRNCMNFFL
jgi:hypothetical protein